MSEPTPGSDRAIFWTLLMLALVLRLWGIWHVSATDEYNEVIEALRVCSGHFNFERWAKRFYLYVLAGEYGIYFSFGWLFGVFSDPLDFATKIVRHMEPLFIMGRVTSALAGAASVGMLYLIGERFFSRSAAVVASLLLTFTVFHIDLSQQAKVDATLGLMVLLSFYFILKILHGAESAPGMKAKPGAAPASGDFALAGLCMGLAIQAKINAVTLFAPFGLVMYFLLQDRREGLCRALLGWFTPAFLAGFVLGNPPVALAPLKFIRDITGISAVYTTAVNVVPGEHIGFVAYPLYFYRTMGAMATVLAAVALICSVWRPSRQKILLLSFLFAFYLLMGASRYLVADYYMIPAVPFIYLLIGDLVSGGFPARKLVGAGRSGGMVMVLVLPLALIAPVVQVAEHELSLVGPHTRYLAKEWIEANIPGGSKILMDSGKSINSFAPPIAENEASLRRVLDRAKGNVAAGRIVNDIVDRNGLIYYELLLETVPEKSYDITSTMFGLQVESLDYYLAHGYEYFIVSKSLKKARTEAYFTARDPEVAAFYRSLDHDGRIELIKVISPSKTSTGGTFYIYRRKNGPPSAGHL